MSKKRLNIINKILGPSPLLQSVGKTKSHLFLFGGHSNQDMCYSDEAFFKILSENIDFQTKEITPEKIYFDTKPPMLKYTLGVPLWVASSLTDELLSGGEERFLGEEVPIDIIVTGGTIPSDLGDINQLREVFDEMKDEMKNFGKKHIN